MANKKEEEEASPLPPAKVDYADKIGQPVDDEVIALLKRTSNTWCCPKCADDGRLVAIGLLEGDHKQTPASKFNRNELELICPSPDCPIKGGYTMPKHGRDPITGDIIGHTKWFPCYLSGGYEIMMRSLTVERLPVIFQDGNFRGLFNDRDPSLYKLNTRPFERIAAERAQEAVERPGRLKRRRRKMKQNRKQPRFSEEG
jgi:hypothetical protein